jgi:glycine cleavage system H protein
MVGWAMSIVEHRTPTNLLYFKKHVWVKICDVYNNIIIVGVTDYLQRQLGTVIDVEFSSDELVERGIPLAWLESIKAVVAVSSPVRCEVMEVNHRLIKEPWLINTSPYDEGWIALLRALNKDELKELQNAETYHEFISALSLYGRYQVS